MTALMLGLRCESYNLILVLSNHTIQATHLSRIATAEWLTVIILLFVLLFKNKIAFFFFLVFLSLRGYVIGKALEINTK